MATHAGYISKQHVINFGQTHNLTPIAFHNFGWHNGVYNSSWTPIVPNRKNNSVTPSGIWAAISRNLSRKKTEEKIGDLKQPSMKQIAEILDDKSDIERLTQSISLSLRSMNITVDQIASYYNEQLVNLLSSGDFPEIRSSNTMESNLYAHVQSFFTHFGAARDYLGMLIAIRMGMPSRIDSFGKMVGNLENIFDKKDSLTTLLFDSKNIIFNKELDKSKGGWQTSGWIKEASNIRNDFVHRKPYGLHFNERFGMVKIIDEKSGLYRYYRPYSQRDNIEIDILDLIISYYRNANLFFLQAAENSGYDSSMFTLADDDIIPVDKT